ncbi:MAG TPA: hypothetical protein VGH32_07880 [Pirellulales bacterium]
MLVAQKPVAHRLVPMKIGLSNRAVNFDMIVNPVDAGDTLTAI